MALRIPRIAGARIRWHSKKWPWGSLYPKINASIKAAGKHYANFSLE
jgi:hypothetical protein